MNAPEGVGWRAKLPPEARPRIVRMIMDALMRLLPISAPDCLGELNNIASRFEEKIFNAAASLADYARRISVKMAAMERNHRYADTDSVIPSQNSLDAANVMMSQMRPWMVMPPMLASMTDINQSAISHTGQTSDMQTVKPVVLQQFDPTNSISNPRQQHPRLSNQQSGLLNMQPSQRALIQRNGSMHPQHRTISSQSMTNVQHRTNMLGQQHQTQLLNSHGSMHPQHITISSQSMTNVQHKTNMLGQQHQNQLLNSQPSAQLLQHAKTYGQVPQTSSAILQGQLPAQQQLMSQLQLHSLQKLQQLSASNELAAKLYADLLERFPAVAALLQPKNRVEQQTQPLQTQRVLPQTPLTSTDSTAQTTHAGSDAQEEIYQKIKSWKEMYISDVRAIYEKLTLRLQQHDGLVLPPGEHSDRLENLRKFRVSVWRLMQFLQLPKCNIHPELKDKLPHFEKQIIALVSSQRKRPPQGQQFHPTGVIDQSAQQQQLLQPDTLRNPAPLMSQHSSSQVERQVLAKIGTHLQPTTLPFVVPSPSTPCGLSLSNSGDHGCQQSVPGQAQAQSLAVGAPGVSTSPLTAELDGFQPNLSTVFPGRASATEQPLECLLKSVKFSSSSVIRSSVSDIAPVVSTIDGIAGVAPGDVSRAAVGEDLAAMTKCQLQTGSFTSQDSSATRRKLKRKISGMPLNAMPSAETLVIYTSELESSGTSNLKRCKMEANRYLHDEIRELNHQLVDTIVEVADDDIDSASESREGTVVKCTFCAVSLSQNLKSLPASAGLLPILPIHLLIPTKYPLCSPVLLDKMPMDHSNGECRDLSAKARSRFAVSLRGLPEKMSLKDMATTWDVSVREVILEYAQQNGGGSFTSRYGAWENCAGS